MSQHQPFIDGSTTASSPVSSSLPERPGAFVSPMIYAPASPKKLRTATSPCIKPCACWVSLAKPYGSVSSAERSKLSMSGVGATKACASSRSTLNQTSSIKPHKLEGSMKHRPSSPRGRRQRLPGGHGTAAFPLRQPPVGRCARDGRRIVLVEDRLQRSVPAPASVLSCRLDHAGSRCPTAG